MHARMNRYVGTNVICRKRRDKPERVFKRGSQRNLLNRADDASHALHHVHFNVAVDQEIALKPHATSLLFMIFVGFVLMIMMMMWLTRMFDHGGGGRMGMRRGVSFAVSVSAPNARRACQQDRFSHMPVAYALRAATLLVMAVFLV
jgi:hypothetical protein